MNFSMMNKTAVRRMLLLALALFLAAHAFCFFNLTFSANSVMVDVSRSSQALTASGSYLQPIYWRVRGSLSSPMLVGLLSCLYLSGTILLLCMLLNFSGIFPTFALCGIVMLGSPMLSLFAGSLHTADASLLSLFLSVAAAFLCLRTRRGWMLSALLVAASLALDPSGLSSFFAPVLLALMRRILGGESVSVSRLLSAACAGAAAVCLYLIGYVLFLKRAGLDASAVLHLSGSLGGAFLKPILLPFQPLTAYPVLNVLLRALLLALTAFSLVLLCHRLSLKAMGALIVCMVLLPLAVNLPVFSETAPGQAPLSFVFVDLALVLVIAEGLRSFHEESNLRFVAIGALGILFLGSIVFSNQVYLKKNLEYQSTLSAMTRVFDRAERVPGYTPGITPVAVIGTLEDSPIAANHLGFERMRALDAAKTDTLITSSDGMIWYTWELLGYPCNFLSTYEQEQMTLLPAVKAMEPYPAASSCQLVDGVMVIKFSEAQD